jgi:pyrroloquinoline quinone (PQQ) biosynthesis protein C
MTEDAEDYDVVVDTLQKKYDVLWKMTQSNMNIDMINIMDQIRFEQMAELEQAINMWNSRK